MLTYAESYRLMESTRSEQAKQGKTIPQHICGPGAPNMEICQQVFAPVLGVSLGNRKFKDPRYLEQCLRWGMQYTRSDMLVAIADSIHAINVQYADGTGPEKAMKTAMRFGQDMRDLVGAAIKTLPPEQHRRVHVAGWDELREMGGDWYKNNLHILKQEFASNAVFRSAVEQVVGLMIQAKKKNVPSKNIPFLCEYVIDELAILTGGVSFSRQGVVEKTFDLLLYPSLGPMQELIHGAQGGRVEAVEDEEPVDVGESLESIDLSACKVLSERLQNRWAIASVAIVPEPMPNSTS